MIGVNQRTVASLEQGRSLNAKHIEPLARALRIEPKELFDFGEPRRVREGRAALSLIEAAAERDPKAGRRAVRLLRLFFGEE